MSKSCLTMDKLVSHCKTVGFVYPGSDIYGGLANTWDYGPLGVELKNNVKKSWWKRFVQESTATYGVDAAILMNSRVWDASGHTASFNDPKLDCKSCKTRYRADTLIEEHSKGAVNPDTMSYDEMSAYIEEHHINCPRCGNHNWTPIRQFNMMFSTSRGVTEEGQDIIYLRPETAQGEFVNFLNVQRTTRAKVPFGIAQIGKSFRNEITPGNFIFRTIEFEQMEHQWFCHASDSAKFYDDYKAKAMQYLLDLGFNADELRFKDHEKLAHYAAAACDINYLFPIGWSELNGIHNRTDYDLSRHQEYSGKSMQYLDPVTNERFVPSVVEYSIGCDRLLLAVLCDAYDEETITDDKGKTDTRIVMHFHPFLAPYKVAILPLQKKEQGEKARELYAMLSKHFMCTYDDAASIGKRYRRQDQIGTPMCVTVDFDTLEDNTVTVRDRDTMDQVRLPIDELVAYIEKRVQFN